MKKSYRIMSICIFTIAICILSTIAVLAYAKNDTKFIDETYANENYSKNDGSIIFSTPVYTYPFTIYKNDEMGNKKTLEIGISYDIVRKSDISDIELNQIIENYIYGIESVYQNSSYSDLITQEGRLSNLEKVILFIESNEDDRIDFFYFISSYKGDLPFDFSKDIDFIDRQNEIYRKGDCINIY